MSTLASPLAQYLTSGLTASSGVDAALLNATPGSNAPTNAITEQLQNLQLPATESLFTPASYWDTVPVTQPTFSNYGVTSPAGVVETSAAGQAVATATNPMTLVGWAVILLLLTHQGGSGRRGTR